MESHKKSRWKEHVEVIWSNPCSKTGQLQSCDGLQYVTVQTFFFPHWFGETGLIKVDTLYIWRKVEPVLSWEDSFGLSTSDKALKNSPYVTQNGKNPHSLKFTTGNLSWWTLSKIHVFLCFHSQYKGYPRGPRRPHEHHTMLSTSFLQKCKWVIVPVSDQFYTARWPGNP